MTILIFDASVVIKATMATIKIDVGDGSENTPVEISKVSNHTVVLVNFTGTVDTTVYLHLPEDAEVGALFEIMSLNIRVAITNSNVYGIPVAESKKSLLSVRKILENSETTDLTWIGSQSLPPSWV